MNIFRNKKMKNIYFFQILSGKIGKIGKYYFYFMFNWKQCFERLSRHNIVFFFLDFCPKIKFKKCSYIGAFSENFRNLQIEEIFWDFLKILKMFTNRSIFENFDIFLNERIWFIKNHILFQGTLVKKKTKHVLTQNKREILWFNDKS